MKHTPEQIRAAKALIDAKVALWSASTVLEAELGFDVDSGGQHLEDAAVMRIALEVDAVKYGSIDAQAEIMVAADRLAHLEFAEHSHPREFWQNDAITDWASACAMIALYLDANKQAPAPEWMREKFVGVAS